MLFFSAARIAAGAAAPSLCAISCSRCFLHASRGLKESSSRRRNAASNTRGRVDHAKELIELMKSKNPEDAKTFYNNLHPRNKLDIIRLLHLKREKRRRHRSASTLPKFFSPLFERNYFFREDDITEESTLGRGPGGQATNRRMQTAIVKHRPSGIIVKFSRFPSLWLNRRAARELLHLRLEEHLIGPASRLGRVRLARERREKRRQRTLKWLDCKGRRLAVKSSLELHWFAFLTGAEPLPSAVAQQLRQTGRDGPLFIGSFFEEKCSQWWPLFSHAFDSVTDRSTSAEVHFTPVPEVFQYLFPSVRSPENQKAAEQLQQCIGNAAVRENVRRSFLCFCELFGLQVVQGARSNEKPDAIVLRKDGVNWLEKQSRMIDGDKLSSTAGAAWAQVYLCLRQLEMAPEAKSIVAFFKRELKLTSKELGRSCWASDAIQGLRKALQNSTKK